jgi:catechol 2,3-dioxygenase-like lactoylglutathione lyase family enzyme
MTIAPQTTGVHHLALRSSDLSRARTFYSGTLGLPIVLETWDSFAALAGGTLVVVRSAEKPLAPSSAGLDHVALSCASEVELERVAQALAAAQVPSTGLQFDAVLRRRYVAFTDPDGIAWEFYMAFSHTEVVCSARY